MLGARHLLMKCTDEQAHSACLVLHGVKAATFTQWRSLFQSPFPNNCFVIPLQSLLRPTVSLPSVLSLLGQNSASLLGTTRLPEAGSFVLAAEGGCAG